MECRANEHDIEINKDGLAICKICGSCRGATMPKQEKEFKATAEMLRKKNFVRKKEFIKRLKEIVDSGKCSCEECISGGLHQDSLFKEIDKLAGDKLI